MIDALGEAKQKFQLGDIVKIMDGKKVLDTGEVSFFIPAKDGDPNKYKVKTKTSRLTYNEPSLKLVKKVK
jgi:hypothetical protein